LLLFCSASDGSAFSGLALAPTGAAPGKTRIALGREDSEAAKRTWMDDMEQKQDNRKRAGWRELALAMAS
jgi:hypothetical protein